MENLSDLTLTQALVFLAGCWQVGKWIGTGLHLLWEAVTDVPDLEEGGHDR